jgi:hypothetical protein
MIKKHRILWAEALFFGVVCISYPRFLGWIDLYVIYLVLAFLVLLAMHEESQIANKTVPKLAAALILLAFIMFYDAPFFPVLDIVPGKCCSGPSNLFSFIGFVSGCFGFFIWKGDISGTLDDETIEK